MHNFGENKLNHSEFNEQFSEKYTYFYWKNVINLEHEGYQKVRRLVRWYLYLLIYAYNLCMENKTTKLMF